MSQNLWATIMPFQAFGPVTNSLLGQKKKFQALDIDQLETRIDYSPFIHTRKIDIHFLKLFYGIQKVSSLTGYNGIPYSTFCTCTLLSVC
jgi:hypothetical protein